MRRSVLRAAAPAVLEGHPLWVRAVRWHRGAALAAGATAADYRAFNGLAVVALVLTCFVLWKLCAAGTQAAGGSAQGSPHP